MIPKREDEDGAVSRAMWRTGKWKNYSNVWAEDAWLAVRKLNERNESG